MIGKLGGRSRESARGGRGRRPASMLAGVLGVAVALLAAGDLGAHSVEDVEKQLAEREQYVQVVEHPAPDFALRDADGREITLKDYRGEVVVLWFVYATCRDVCPLHSQKVAQLQEEINRTPARDLVEFVAITTDPEQDTPEVLRAYGPAQGLDPHNWVFLTSRPGQPADATRSLASDYGVEFMPTDDRMQVHGTLTHLIDREGVVRARYHGRNFNTTNFLVHVNALVNDQVPHAHPEPGFWEKLFSWF